MRRNHIDEVSTMKKKFIGFYVREEIRDALHEMAKADRRTLGATLEIIVVEEIERRERARQLVDTPAEYGVGGPAQEARRETD